MNKLNKFAFGRQLKQRKMLLKSQLTKKCLQIQPNKFPADFLPDPHRGLPPSRGGGAYALRTEGFVIWRKKHAADVRKLHC